MRRPAALFPIALALGAIILAPRAGAQEQGWRAEGPIEIEKCQTISKSGSYKLVNNFTFTGTTGTCLSITADFVAIDLGGFTISGPGTTAAGTGIAAGNDTTGIAVRNGTISGFLSGVNLGGDGSVVEGLRVFGVAFSSLGIAATGIVKGNTVARIGGAPGSGVGISATGIVTGNYVLDSRYMGIGAGQGSTVIGNTASSQSYDSSGGIVVSCPSNVTDNTVTGTYIGAPIVLIGNGCNNTNNVAP